MGVRASLAAWSLVVCAAGGCAAPTGADEPPPEPPPRDEPMDVAVDSLDVVHGALRVIATMTDGAADVSVRLGGGCEHREVGAGLSTPSRLIWALGERDVADALDCGLVVRAKAREGAQAVNKVAELAVAFELTTEEGEGPGDAPDLQSIPRVDFARCVLGDRPLRIAGASYAVSMTVGGTTLQVDAPQEEPPATDDVEE
jgi:hypothetical protein